MSNLRSVRVYTYKHLPGYGRCDHMAAEIIARAARILGLDGAQHAIAQCAGYVSSPVPLGAGAVQVPVARGTKVRMRSALRRAYREVPSGARDVSIAVVEVRS